MNNQELINQLPNKYGFKPIFRLRWRFEFRDKPARIGPWNGSSDRKEDKAAFISKTGLTNAIIEAEKHASWGISRLLDIPGSRYVSAQWECCASVPMFLNKDGKPDIRPGSVIAPGTIVGLSFLTPDEKLTVFIDGHCKVTKLSEQDRKFKHFTEHKLGE